MSETNKKKENDIQNQSQSQDKQTLDVNVRVDNKTTEELMRILEEEKKKRLELEKKYKEEAERLKQLEEEAKKKAEEAEDYRAKLAIIAEKEFEKKKSAILEKAKTVMDEERLKQIEEQLTDPEKLKATEFMVDTLIEAMEKLEKEKKPEGGEGADEGEGAGEGEGENPPKEGEGGEDKEKKPPAGNVPLSSQQTSGEEGGYESYEAMIKDLYKKKHSADPEEAAEAEAILDELFKKWARAVKKRYEGKIPQGISVEKEKQPPVKAITKKGGEA